MALRRTVVNVTTCHGLPTCYGVRGGVEMMVMSDRCRGAILAVAVLMVGWGCGAGSTRSVLLRQGALPHQVNRLMSALMTMP